MNNFNEWIQCFLNETKNILSSDKQILIIEGVLRLLNETKSENRSSNQSIDLMKDEEENKPTNIQYYPNGNVSFKAWYGNGNVLYKQWYINDKFHNDNGPAVIEYNENGNVLHKQWWINGKRHNDNGPAIIEYDQNGNIIIQEYWKNGKKIK